MTELNNKHSAEDFETGFWPAIRRTLIPSLWFGLGLGLFLAGPIVGLRAWQEQDVTALTVLLCGISFIAGLAVIALTFRKWPTLRAGELDTPRTRRLGKITWALLAMSTTIAIIMVGSMPANTDALTLYSNAPLPAGVTAIVAGIWAVSLPVLTYFAQRNIDEIERAHFQFGETIAMRAFAVIAPVWWLGFRGGWAPRPDVMIVFIAVLVISMLANAWHRYR